MMRCTIPGLLQTVRTGLLRLLLDCKAQALCQEACVFGRWPIQDGIEKKKRGSIFFSQLTAAFPKEGQGTRNTNFLRYPYGSKNELFLFSAAQNISHIYLTSRLALLISFGLPLGLLRYVAFKLLHDIPVAANSALNLCAVSII
jgi:hypothetical protein